MKTYKLLPVLAALLALGAGGLARADNNKNDNGNSGGNGQIETQDVRQEHGRYHAQVCSSSDNATDIICSARVVTDQKGNPQTSALPAGLGPKDFHAAYASQTTTPGKQIIAIVDAYDDPNILDDLNVYSSTFGLPTMKSCSVAAATAAAPCFQKINQQGSTKYPAQNAGWALEIALDAEVAHATCQNCSILLVEANSNSYADLMTAVDRAISSGATVVSNSYGSSEFSGETSYDSHFKKTGVAITFPSGDSGYGTMYPASSQYVTAVGGTTLNFNADKTYKNETAWSGSGSGCSVFEAKPLWQHDAGCKKRTIADVSAVADPYTGAAVYDSMRYSGRSGWFQVGGTSLSSPLVAGVYALAGGVANGVFGNSIPYANAAVNFHDITLGSNGKCGGSYLCTALAGYDNSELAGPSMFLQEVSPATLDRSLCDVDVASEADPAFEDPAVVIDADDPFADVKERMKGVRKNW